MGDEKKIDDIITTQQKEVELGKNLRKKDRENFDIAFNISCFRADYKEVKRLVKEEHCDGFREGLIGLCSRDYNDYKYENDVEEMYHQTFDYLIDEMKMDKVSIIFIDNYILISLENNNLITLKLFLNLQERLGEHPQDEDNYVWNVLFSDYTLKKIGIDVYEYLANILKDVEHLRDDFHKLVRKISYEIQDEALFEATLKHRPKVKLTNELYNSGMYLPLKIGFDQYDGKQPRDEIFGKITKGGNLETFKKIVKDQNLNINDKVLSLMWLPNAYITKNKNGLELIKYLEQYHELNDLEWMKSIELINIMSHAIDKYGHLLSDEQKE